MLRRVLFALPAEEAHSLARLALRLTPIWSHLGPGPPSHPRLTTRVGPIRLATPVGLAPGFDKDCDVLASLMHLGFGFLAPGSIMAEVRAGNRRPRLGRVVKDEGIINAMGLPSRGVDYACARLERLGEPLVPLFIDVQGTTPDEILENARRVQPFAQAVEVSLVCPNTPDTDANGSLASIRGLCGRLRREIRVPLFAKIPVRYRSGSPAELQAFLDVCIEHEFDGVIACGARHIKTTRLSIGHGQLGGRPVFADTLRLVADVRDHAGAKLKVIASGGIFSGRDLLDVLQAGASVGEIYSALVYRGPAAAAAISAELLDAMDERSIPSIASLSRTDN